MVPAGAAAAVAPPPPWWPIIIIIIIIMVGSIPPCWLLCIDLIESRTLVSAWVSAGSVPVGVVRPPLTVAGAVRSMDGSSSGGCLFDMGWCPASVFSSRRATRRIQRSRADRSRPTGDVYPARIPADSAQRDIERMPHPERQPGRGQPEHQLAPARHPDRS